MSQDMPTHIDAIIRRFEEPDEVRQMVKGKFEIVHIGGMTNRPSDIRRRVESVRR